MPIYNLPTYTGVIFNGVDLTEIFFNGVSVWVSNVIDTSVTTININETHSNGNFGFKLSYSGTSPTITVDWGDNTETVATNLGSIIAHTYAENKSYTIKLYSTKPYYIDYFGVNTIDDTAGSYVSSLILNEDITQLPSMQVNFRSPCTNLNYIFIGKNIAIIPSQCFYGLTSLTTVDIDKDSVLATVEGQSFSGCSGLTKLWFPSSLTTVKALYNFASLAPFVNCSADLVIYLEGTVQSGFYATWNRYSSTDATKLLTYYENFSYEDYKNL